MNTEEIKNINELFVQNGWKANKIDLDLDPDLIYSKASLPYHEFIIYNYRDKEKYVEEGSFEVTVPLITNRFAYNIRIESYLEIYNHLATHLVKYT